ncbi:uncharacterized protein MELLADRAFT_59465 [Melampsora larici-populina 98AG31]|uniref:Uncharacterized protein n=1 Tax=Melampsora larici-populina (strain 98AG31 / pathotype 3-4-7) TaxID=747676 RepID=F4R7L1_MELLP|nr:uncharacterized protein MELLADRAFT_59465 [Melampsora larici-populina 98AG31]EGG11334.1 hypothetical protein MELLADRAFT_59465 [Melampsora larici-populina 98AG31]
MENPNNSKLDSLQALNDLKVMISQIQNVHESTEALRQSIDDLENLRTLFSSHEEKFSELLRSPIALQEHINNTESQLSSMKGTVSNLCDDVGVVTSQINEQGLTLNVLDARLDAMEFKVDERQTDELATQGELKRLGSCNLQLKNDQMRLNNDFKLVQSKVLNDRQYSEEQIKSMQSEMQRLDSCNQQLKDDQVRLNKEIHLIQHKFDNSHLHCSGEIKKVEEVLHTQIQSNRTVCFFPLSMMLI